ncbi:MAG: hypothetical protein KAG94_01830 [Clostridiales bacterium]|nr:hypothetical protein [Clostridiales bacterium]
MKKLLIIGLISTLIFTSCSNSLVIPLDEEPINTFEVTKDSEINSSNPTPTETTESQGISLDEKFANIDFYLVAGVYSRNVLQDDIKMTEIFAIDKTNFVRVASNEFEQEVFAYNYVSDNFTYLYYFDDEIISKTIFNIDTGAILEDIDGYSELLKVKAEEIKVYFNALIEKVEITIEEIK